MRKKSEYLYLRNSFRNLVISASLILLSGCSLGPGLFGNGKDKGVAALPSYRKVNPNCDSVKIGQEDLTVGQLRALMGCLNANGAIPALQDFLDKTEDRDLEPLVQLIDLQILKDPKILYGLLETAKVLEKKGELRPVLTAIANLGSHEEWLQPVVALFRKNKILGGLTGDYELANPDLLKAFEVVGSHWKTGNTTDAATLGKAIDDAIVMLKGRSFDALTAKLLGPGGKLSLKETAQAISDYLDQSASSSDLRFFNELIEVTVDGTLPQALDPLVGTTAQEVRAKAKKFSVLFHEQFKDEAQFALELSDAAHLLHDPISCFEGSVRVERPLLLDLQEMSEITAPTDQLVADKAVDKLSRIDRLRVLSLVPYCSFPKGIDKAVDSVKSTLSKSQALVPFIDVLRSLFTVSKLSPQGYPRYPLVELLTDLLGDPNFKTLVPVLMELDQKDLWDELILVATRPVRTTSPSTVPVPVTGGPVSPNEDNYLIEARPELSGKSVSGVLLNTLSESDASEMFNLLNTAKEVLQAKDTLILPVFEKLRSVVYANNAAVASDLIRNILKNATHHENLFLALFRMVDQKPFRVLLKSLPSMAENGQLSDLLNALVDLLDRRAQQGHFPLAWTSLPQLPAARHDWVSADLLSYTGPTPSVGLDPHCDNLDLDSPITNTTSAAFESQIKEMVACLNSTHKQDDLAQALGFLGLTKAEDGRPLFGVLVDLVKGMNLTKPTLVFGINKFLEKYEQGTVDRIVEALPFFTLNPYSGNGTTGAVLEPIGKVLQSVLSIPKAKEAFKQLEAFGGRLLKMDELPPSLGYLDKLNQAQQSPPALENNLPQYSQEKVRLEKWIKAKECALGNLSSSELERRSAEVIADYSEALSNWEYPNGHVRKSWNFSEFKTLTEEALDKMAEPAVLPNPVGNQAGGQTHLIDSLVQVLRYFSLKQGQAPNQHQHFTPSYLREYFSVRSKDYRPVSFIYPGEKSPRVRYLNSMDRLELVVILSDFVPPWPYNQNWSLYFLQMLGDAWGDEDRKIWPAEIEQKYLSTGVWPMTLKQAADEIWKQQLEFENIMGFPAMDPCVTQVPGDPDDVVIPNHGLLPPGLTIPFIDLQTLKVSLYNLRQVLSVLEENLPGAPGKQSGGLRILRDLFFQMGYSTPEKDRNPKAGWKNHLSLVTRLARMGLFRQMGRVMQDLPGSDLSLSRFYDGFLVAAGSPEVKTLLDQLLVNDKDHGLIWEVLKQVFSLTDETQHLDWKARGQNLRDAAFYSFAALQDLMVVEPMLKGFNLALKAHSDFLKKHMADLLSPIAEENSASLFWKLIEDIDPQSLKLSKLQPLAIAATAEAERFADLLEVAAPVVGSPAAKTLKQRGDALRADPAFKALDFDKLTKDLKDFAFESATLAPEGLAAAQEMRKGLASQLEKNALSPFLAVSSTNPDDFYQIIRALGVSSENGDLQGYLRYVHRGLTQK